MKNKPTRDTTTMEKTKETKNEPNHGGQNNKKTGKKQVTKQ
jgi:hypothetical protein